MLEVMAAGRVRRHSCTSRLHFSELKRCVGVVSCLGVRVGDIKNAYIKLLCY